MLRIAHYTYDQVFRFALARKIEGIPTAAVVEVVSPGVLVEVNAKVRARKLTGSGDTPLASFASLVNDMQPHVADLSWHNCLDKSGKVTGTRTTVRLHLPWNSAVIERLIFEEDRFRIVICSERLWQHGVWNPQKFQVRGILVGSEA